MSSITEHREYVLHCVSHGLLERAQRALEFILLSDEFASQRCWVDYYRLLVVLELQGHYHRVTALGSSLLGHETGAPTVFYKFALMKAHWRLKEYESAEKAANELVKLPSELAFEAEGLPPGYAPSTSTSILVAQANEYLALRRQQEGKFDKYHALRQSAIELECHMDDKIILQHNRILQAAMSRFGKGEYAACLELLDRFRGSPVSPLVELDWLTEALAVCYAELGMDVELFDAQQRSLHGPSKKLHHYAAGLYSQTIGKYDEARRHFLQATGIDEMYKPAWMALGHSYSAIGDNDQATMCYAHIIRHIDDRCVAALVAMAAEYIRIGRPVLASPYIQMALSVDKDDPFALNELGMVFYLRGELEKAVDVFQRALAAIEAPVLRADIGRNVVLAKLKLSCIRQSPTDLTAALQEAKENAAGSLPLIQELLSKFTDRSDSVLLLSKAIDTLATLTGGKADKILLNGLIEQRL